MEKNRETKKKIVIFGKKNSGKTKLYKDISKAFFSIKGINFHINNHSLSNDYNENEIMFGNLKYDLIDLPSYHFFSQQGQIIEKNKKDLMEEQLLNAYLIILVIDCRKIDEEDISIIKQLEHRNIVILFNNYSEDIFDTSHILRRIIENAKNYFFIIEDLKKFLILELNKNKLDFHSKEKEDEINEIKIKIIGFPNVGKSSFSNYLLERNRSLVSSESGTTKGYLRSFLKKGDLLMSIEDNEGLEKKVYNNYFRGDIILLILDCSKEITKKDLTLVNLVVKLKKPLIIVFNKSDISRNKKFFLKQFTMKTGSLSKRLLITFASCIKREGKETVINFIDEIIRESSISIDKKVLDEQFKTILSQSIPETKFYFTIHKKGFLTIFIIFVNKLSNFKISQKKYIIRRIRESFNLKSIPIDLIFKEK